MSLSDKASSERTVIQPQDSSCCSQRCARAHAYTHTQLSKQIGTRQVHEHATPFSVTHKHVSSQKNTTKSQMSQSHAVLLLMPQQKSQGSTITKTPKWGAPLKIHQSRPFFLPNPRGLTSIAGENTGIEVFKYTLLPKMIMPAFQHCIECQASGI